MRFESNIKRVLLALLPLAALAAAPAGPALEFQSDRVEVRGLTAGERVAWAVMLREPVGYIERVRVLRGVGTAGQDGTLSIQQAGVDPSRSAWLFSSLDKSDPGRTIRIAPNGEMDAEEIAVTIEPAKIMVESAAIDLTYIQPNGDTYYYFGADGGSIDDDGEQNGQIVIGLSRLIADPTSTNPHPPDHPTTIQSGAIVLLFDIYEWRMREVVVR